MRVGTLCYATDQGLGRLAKDFYDNGVVTAPFVVRHSSRPTNPGWYPGAPVCGPGEMRFRRAVSDYLRTVDVLFLFETPFWWGVIPECKRLGVKTVLMPMYECMPADLPHQPDLILNPSDLDQRHFPTGVRASVPVYAKTWRRRADVIRTFVHNAGHGGLRGRNGTAELVAAWPWVNVNAHLIVRTQGGLPDAQAKTLLDCGNVDVRVGTFPHESLYDEGECFVFPEKFNGVSLPLQEAFAAGMVVAATDRFPNTEWLPRGPLVPIRGTTPQRVGRGTMTIDEAVVDPQDIADKLNELYGTDATALGVRGRTWATQNDWGVWGPWYRAKLAELMGVSP